MQFCQPCKDLVARHRKAARWVAFFVGLSIFFTILGMGYRSGNQHRNVQSLSLSEAGDCGGCFPVKLATDRRLTAGHRHEANDVRGSPSAAVKSWPKGLIPMLSTMAWRTASSLPERKIGQQIAGIVLPEAGVKFPLGGYADPIAGIAEIVAVRGDEADPGLAARNAPVACRPA